ncbi:MAG: hypothetical protein FWK01_29330 [Pantanalinema sp. GBBB05]|nr:hypothetical protein [Pantanalinema sp. GBBB05]
MLALITLSLKSLAVGNQRAKSSTTLLDHNSMQAQHTCPCCSYILLRHIDSKGLYWRCSHCYEEMPAWS